MTLSAVFLFLLAGAATPRASVEPLPGLRAEAAARLMAGEAGGNLAAAVAVGRLENRDAEAVLPLSFEIGVGELRPARAPETLSPPESTETTRSGQEARPTLEIYVYALDAASAVLGHVAERLVLSDPREFRGLRYGGTLSFAAAPSLPLELRVLLLETGASRSGLWTFRIDEEGRPPPRLEDPQTSRARPGWIDVGNIAPEVAPIAGPPVLTPGEHRLRVVGRPLIAPDAKLLLVHRATNDSTTIPATFSSSGEAVQLSLPSLRSGPYRWQLEGTEDSGDLWVLRTSAAADARSPTTEKADWLDAARWLESQRSRATALSLTSVDQVAPAEKLRERLFRVLRDFGRHWEPLRAARELTAAEHRAFRAELDRPAVETLERELLSEIADREARASVALMGLLVQAYELAREEDRFADAGRYRRIAHELARSSDPSVHTQTARQLTRLSLSLSQFGLWPSVQNELETAIELSPDQAAAHALLAGVLERQGAVEAARTSAQKAFELDRGLHRNRLRLAVLLRRLGAEERALDHFRSLLFEAEDDADRTLACQEIALVLKRQRRPTDAIEQLDSCLARTSRKTEIYPLLIHLLERAGQDRRARELAATPPPAPTVPTARLVYAEVPERLLTTVRESSERSLRLSAPALATVLESRP
ncbi:MAG: hypothetical protein AAGK22_06480 [Acidobacteriota bacterium]